MNRVELKKDDREFALTAASQAFYNHGIEIPVPWEGDLDDLEQERFEAMVAAIDAYNETLARALAPQAGEKPEVAEAIMTPELEAQLASARAALTSQPVPASSEQPVMNASSEAAYFASIWKLSEHQRIQLEAAFSKALHPASLPSRVSADRAAVIEAERKRAVAVIHWVFSADGTKGERSMADEAIDKINDPTFMVPSTPPPASMPEPEGWVKFKAGDVAPFFPHGTRVDVEVAGGDTLLNVHPTDVNWGHDSSVTRFRLPAPPLPAKGQ